ncbi:branched-chain amino acid ABC transporter permease [Aneurinibacillus sp. REN35]|uniref:branched-chain amino acid ABC transporter permease n=1 Tax=Aneurinibacillus sp. REN35 TaxID=3237286 RepID=UPI0035272FA9
MKYKGLLGSLALLVIMALVPLFVSDDSLHVLILILFFAFLSQAWNIMSGYSGQFSFGHAAFFGTGAYMSTMLFVKYQVTPWVGLFIGAAVAMLIGLFIGFLSFRYKLKGAYFALATLAFAEILRIVVQNTELLNKTMGFLIPLNMEPKWFQFEYRFGYYYIALLMVALITMLVYMISRSRLGYSLIAIRENEDAAQSLGVNTYRNKMIAVAISSALTAVGGTFYAQYIMFIEPPMVFSSDMSVSILLPAIIGGVGTVFGPIVGAFLIIPLGELTTMYLGNFAGANLIAYGIIMLLIILYLPEGLVGWYQNRRNKKRQALKQEPSQKPGVKNIA